MPAGYSVSHCLILVVGAEQIVVADLLQCFFQGLPERAKTLLFILFIEDN
jgi:hypothetical protein